MRQVMLPVLDDYTCRTYFRVTSSIQFCAGNRLNKFNTCKGDSGIFEETQILIGFGLFNNKSRLVWLKVKIKIYLNHVTEPWIVFIIKKSNLT